MAEEESQRICEKEAAGGKTIVGTEEWLGIKPLSWELDLAQRGFSFTGTRLCAAPRKKPSLPDLAHASLNSLLDEGYVVALCYNFCFRKAYW